MFPGFMCVKTFKIILQHVIHCSPRNSNWILIKEASSSPYKKNLEIYMKVSNTYLSLRMGQIDIVLSFRGAQVTLMNFEVSKKVSWDCEKGYMSTFPIISCQNTPEARCQKADHLEDHPVPQQDDVWNTIIITMTTCKHLCFGIGLYTCEQRW